MVMLLSASPRQGSRLGEQQRGTTRCLTYHRPGCVVKHLLCRRCPQKILQLPPNRRHHLARRSQRLLRYPTAVYVPAAAKLQQVLPACAVVVGRTRAVFAERCCLLDDLYRRLCCAAASSRLRSRRRCDCLRGRRNIANSSHAAGTCRVSSCSLLDRTGSLRRNASRHYERCVTAYPVCAARGGLIFIAFCTLRSFRQHFARRPATHRQSRSAR